MKYRFAEGADKSIVDVLDLDESTRRSNAPYTCQGCEKELIAVLPKTDRVNHFSHKFAGECSPETYLHKMGKKIFFEEYKRSLELNKPFDILIKQPMACSHFYNTTGVHCMKSGKARIDLTQYFDQVVLEKSHGQFRPDILLSSSSKDIKIYVEIVVTHKPEKEKIDSGVRILEIPINDEIDFLPILCREIDTTQGEATAINFKTKTVTKDHCKGKCDSTIEILTVNENGAVATKTIDIKSVNLSLMTSNNEYVQVLGVKDKNRPQNIRRRKEGLKSAYLDGISVKSCYLCKNNIGTQGDLVHCSEYRVWVPSSDYALWCEGYNPGINEND